MFIARKHILLIIYIICAAVTDVVAKENDTLAVSTESVGLRSAGSLSRADSSLCDVSRKKGNILIKAANSVLRFFSPEVNDEYIEPQRYNFTAMAQVTNTDDYFVLRGERENSISLSPKRKLKVGPFFGWRWLFFGYTFNVNSLEMSHSNVDINTTLYTPAVGIDFVYRNLGEGYQIRDFKLKEYGSIDYFKGMTTNSLDIDILSINAFYALNSKKYSQQAVFNQTNRQIRSAGSWIVGTGYNQCRVSMDWVRFDDELSKALPSNSPSQEFNDSALFFKNLSYRSIPFSLGYGYNWAFANHWTCGAQLLGSLSYMWSKGDAYNQKVGIETIIKDFRFSNFTFDGTIRVGVVWNNSRWFAGANAIYHTYHYHQSHLEADNIFGTLNLYFGFNFWRK